MYIKDVIQTSVDVKFLCKLKFNQILPNLIMVFGLKNKLGENMRRELLLSKYLSIFLPFPRTDLK